MKILAVSFVDDNFGDNLISICFEKILKVVLLNHGFSDEEYSITKMGLKLINEVYIENSDIVFFAGGGLFGLSYLDFFKYLNKIVQIANENNIPVFFSSIGINNMGMNASEEEVLTSFFDYSCIKAISVRENIDLFKKYTEKIGIGLTQVCDPAVWTKFVYNLKHTDKSKSNNKLVGINVVRGGLFQDNGYDWKLADELNFLKSVSDLLEQRGLEYRFYTNGSVLDNNALHYFAQKYNVSGDKCVYPHTTREVVETINKFDIVLAFRMHSSIIAYSFAIPSIALAWNDKIPLFYEYIGCSDRVLKYEEWNADNALKILEKIITDKITTRNEKEYQEYLMSLYDYLYYVIKEFCLKEENESTKFDFEMVVAHLKKCIIGVNEDVFDMRVKLDKAEKQYLARFVDLKSRDKEIKIYKRSKKDLEKDLEKCKKTISTLSKKNLELEKQNVKDKEKYCLIINDQKKEIALLQKRFSVRLINYLKKRMKKV